MNYTIDAISREVAAYFGIDYKEFTAKAHSRKYTISRPRWVAWYIAKQLKPKCSYPMLGKKFGYDHSAVLHAVHNLPNDETYYPIALELMEKITNRKMAA